MLYMCAVIDLCGRMVLAYRIGSDMSASLVTQTIRDALNTEKVTDGLALHSDQGAQYTSTAYFGLSKEYHFQPSMSNPGCPYDNAAMENFFGTLKSECLYRAHDTTHPEVKERIAQYIPFSNFEGISLKNGLTPHESRSKAAQYRVMLRHLLFVSVQTGTVHFSLPLNAVPSTPAALLQVRFRFLHIPYQCKQR